MDTQRLLIADGTEEFRNELTDSLRGCYQIRSSGEGREALEILRAFSPDILVLDLMLPGLDGISVLQLAAREIHPPVVLATTCFISSYVLESVQKLGVGYLMVKPCDVDAAAMRVEELSERGRAGRLQCPRPKMTVSNQLLSLGVPTKLRGYSCLREAVQIMAKNPTQSVTKELYPAVAERCSGNTRQVERSIRTAIQAAWENRDERIWRQYFQPDLDGRIPRPTNAAFISRLAESMAQESDD